jgi:hypothetical protein
MFLQWHPVNLHLSKGNKGCGLSRDGVLTLPTFLPLPRSSILQLSEIRRAGRSSNLSPSWLRYYGDDGWPGGLEPRGRVLIGVVRAQSQEWWYGAAFPAPRTLFRITEWGRRSRVAGTCPDCEWGRRTKINRNKRRREGDGVPAAASDARPPHVSQRRRILSACTGKADGWRAHPWFGRAESDGGEVTQRRVVVLEEGARRGPARLRRGPVEHPNRLREGRRR